MSASPRYRPSDAPPTRFCLWLLLTTMGVALLVVGDSLVGNLGVALLCISGLVVTPHGELQRSLRVREYLPVLAFFLVVPLGLVVATQFLPFAHSTTRSTDGTGPSWLKASFAVFWAVVALRELRHFRHTRTATGA